MQVNFLVFKIELLVFCIFHSLADFDKPLQTITFAINHQNNTFL